MLGEAWQNCALLSIDDEKKALKQCDDKLSDALKHAPLDVGYRYVIGGEAKTNEQHKAEAARWNALSADAKEKELTQREEQAVQQDTVYLGRVHRAAAEATWKQLNASLPFLVGQSVGLLQKYVQLSIERYEGDASELDALAALKQAIDGNNTENNNAKSTTEKSADNNNNNNAKSAPAAPSSAPQQQRSNTTSSTSTTPDVNTKARKLIGGRYATHYNSNYEQSMKFCAALLKKIEIDVTKFVDDAKQAKRTLKVLITY